ncbi:MAG TPA: hypothetical protein DEP28_04720 [Bacteroidetes bacterium]|nr:ATP-binding protein [Ignavibacteria bacterium]HCA42539.1 hypothetical protein [Bacteroidota bacterium]HCN37004.1 hypothetical protein [Bacteroidota bacterium]
MDKITLYVPSKIENIHFVSDVTEAFSRSRIKFENEQRETDFMTDLKLIIYELFSNCVLHGNTDKIKINYDIVNDHLEIRIELVGKGFMIKPVKLLSHQKDTSYYPPYPAEIHNDEFILYHDSENEVLCKVLGEKELFFKCIKLPEENAEIENIPEHYGIMLITSLSEHFSYKRSEDNVDIFFLKKSIKEFI